MHSIKYINMENVGVLDQQAAYIMQALRGACRIKVIHFSKNVLGEKFLKSLDHESLQRRIREINISYLVDSEVWVEHFLKRF